VPPATIASFAKGAASSRSRKILLKFRARICLRFTLIDAAPDRTARPANDKLPEVFP
jgi:hypothetical protein